MSASAPPPKSNVFVPGPGGGVVAPKSAVFVPGPGGGGVSAAPAVFVPGPGGGAVSGAPKLGTDGEEETDRQRRVRIAPLMKVLKLIHQNKHALYFRAAVTDEEVDMEEYRSVIQTPMDLSTLKVQLEEGKVDSAEDLWTGLMLVVDNAQKFNETDSDVSEKAQKLREFMRKEMESVLEVEKMIASSPHNTATRHKGQRNTTPAGGRKPKKEEAEADEPKSGKKRGRSDVDADDEEKKPDEKKAKKKEDTPSRKSRSGGGRKR